jgi:hypothetical protein
MRMMESFIPQNLRPALMFYDNHQSHLNVSTLTRLAENDIWVVGFVPDSTAISQPLDACGFGPFKGKYGKMCSQFTIENVDEPKKVDVARLLCRAYGDTFNLNMVDRAFEMTGTLNFISSILFTYIMHWSRDSPI